MSEPAGMLPPFATQSEENRAMARHCSTGIEPRISAERIILLDTQVLLLDSYLFFQEKRREKRVMIDMIYDI